MCGCLTRGLFGCRWQWYNFSMGRYGLGGGRNWWEWGKPKREVNTFPCILWPVMNSLYMHAATIRYGCKYMPTPMVIPKRRLQLFTSWTRLWDLLTETGIPEEEEIKYLTYCIRGHDRGRRQISVLGRTQYGILSEVDRVWQDVIEGRSFLVHFIHPQPDDLPRDVIGLIVKVPVPEYDVDHLAPILYEELHYSTVDLDHIQKLSYIHRRAMSMDVYDIGKVRRLCQPLGTNECLIHHDGQVYDSAGSYFRVHPGNYIVLLQTWENWRQTWDFQINNSCQCSVPWWGFMKPKAILDVALV